MRTRGAGSDQGNKPRLGTSTITSLTCLVLLSKAVICPSLHSAQEPITETLLQQPSGASAAGRLWPGFSAGQGLDTGATAEPNGVKPEQVDTGATAAASGAAPEPLRTDLSPGGIPSGGDLSSRTVPWMGSGAEAVTSGASEPLTGGVPTSGGIGLGGGSPLGSGTSLPNFGNLAAGMFGQTMVGGPGMLGLTSIPGVPNVPGLQGLGSTMGLFGMLSILNSLPQMIEQLPQFVMQLPKMLLDSLQSIGQMLLSLFQVPQMIWQSLSGMGEGLMGSAGQLGQTVTPDQQPGTGQNFPNGVAGAVAGGMPPRPGAPSGTAGSSGRMSYSEKNSQWGQNGYLDISAGQLVKVENVYLQPEMAEKYYALKAGAEAAGHKIWLTDGYRSYAGQVACKAKWTNLGKPQYAATPGRSNHGWGMAFDIGGTSGARQWCQDNMVSYGLRNYRGGTNPVYGYEEWHFQAPGL